MSRKRHSDDSLLFEDDVCAFCGRNEDDETLYGKFIATNTISVHTNCMFLASGLSQRGKNEKEGISGFRLRDIKIELLRGKKLNCTYCKKRGATIGCCNSKCKRSFHLPCGIEHGALNQFFGSFFSFCKDHAPKQKDNDVKDTFCYICCEEIPREDLCFCLYSPCCKNSWFHKICVQKYALSAGAYFFKCPLCNNSCEFNKEMKDFGICIPEKDASWELEENAYQELLVRPPCSASVCLCNKGRKYDSSKYSVWALVPCTYCGASATHKKCSNIKVRVTTWVCPDCKALEQEILKNKELSCLRQISLTKAAVRIQRLNLSSSSNFSSYSCFSSDIENQEKVSHDDTSNISIQLHDSTNNGYVKESDKIQLHDYTNIDHCLKNSDKVDISESINLQSSDSNSHETESEGSKSSNTININDNVDVKPKQKTDVDNQQEKNVLTSNNNVSLKRVKSSKGHSIKKAKKRKTNEHSHSCDDPNHSCIKKFFGQPCGNFKVSHLIC